jgi:hypothetical protein
VESFYPLGDTGEKMKKSILSMIIGTATLVMAGCDHSTNSEPPPPGSGLSIVSPTPNAVVEGVVDIAVSVEGVVPEKIEFYVDDNLLQTRTSSPWNATWDTSSLPSNTSHRLRARAYNSANAFTTSDDVLVKKK